MPACHGDGCHGEALKHWCDVVTRLGSRISSSILRRIVIGALEGVVWMAAFTSHRVLLVGH